MLPPAGRTCHSPTTSHDVGASLLDQLVRIGHSWISKAGRTGFVHVPARMFGLSTATIRSNDRAPGAAPAASHMGDTVLEVGAWVLNSVSMLNHWLLDDALPP